MDGAWGPRPSPFPLPLISLSRSGLGGILGFNQAHLSIPQCMPSPDDGWPGEIPVMASSLPCRVFGKPGVGGRLRRRDVWRLHFSLVFTLLIIEFPHRAFWCGERWSTSKFQPLPGHFWHFVECTNHGAVTSVYVCVCVILFCLWYSVGLIERCLLAQSFFLFFEKHRKLSLSIQEIFFVPSPSRGRGDTAAHQSRSCNCNK